MIDFIESNVMSGLHIHIHIHIQHTISFMHVRIYHRAVYIVYIVYLYEGGALNPFMPEFFQKGLEQFFLQIFS